ncbi:MAG TPA: ATP-binding protein [Blastocatellia bacterium]|nr:ATP-binding protein [Blastocatellia bacterium]
MRSTSWLRLPSLKLHTRTTILTSAVLVAVFAIMAYFSDLAITRLSDQQERQDAQLLATRVADTVELHLTRLKRREERRTGKKRTFQEFELTTIPDWDEVREAIEETVIKDKPQLAEVRVFARSTDNDWVEKVTLPVEADPLSAGQIQEVVQHSGKANVIVQQAGDRRSIAARAAIHVPESGGPAQIGAVSVLLNFDQQQSSAAALRRLIWPLMLLAIIAITLMTYFLFRHIVYKPIDSLLLAMSKAEAGNLAAEVPPQAPDEIGLLTSRFNRMLGRIRQMTEQLNLEQRALEGRVKEATAEIAERKEQLEDANLELFEMQRQLTQLERLAAAGQLAAQFAHEVGTPLNLISGHVQLLRARAADDRTIKRLDIIAGQIERIANIVRSMLASTRRPRPQIELIDLNALLTRILDATQPTLVARSVELMTDLIEGLPPVAADPDQLQQVFINLINNSLDAMPGGGQLRVRTAREGLCDLIELSDSGEGIKDEQLDLIFEPMFTTKQGAGTGLGLTVVKQIVTEHNGSVEVESEPGRRTTFRIRLPIDEASAEEVAARAAPEPLLPGLAVAVEE